MKVTCKRTLIPKPFEPIELTLRFDTMEDAVRVRNTLGDASGAVGDAVYHIFAVLDDEVLAQNGPECPE